MQTVEFALSKDEQPIYDTILSVVGFEPELYRSKQLVEAPPEHYAELVLGFTSQKVIQLVAVGENDIDYDTFELMSIGLDICEKYATAINEAGYAVRADQAMEDMDGIQPLMPPEELSKASKYGMDVKLPNRVQSSLRYLLDCSEPSADLDSIRQTLDDAE